MKTGFIKDKVLFRYSPGKEYRVLVVVHNNRASIKINHSPELILATTTIDNVKTGSVYVVFTVGSLDLRQDYFISLDGVENATLLVQFESVESDKWTLASQATPGNNILVLQKNTRTVSPVVHLSCAGNKILLVATPVDAWTIQVDAALQEGKKYVLLLQEGISVYQLPLPSFEKTSSIAFTPELNYHSGKISMKLHPNSYVEPGHVIRVEGDLSKTVTWREDMDIHFLQYIKAYKDLSFSINGIKHTYTLLDPAVFPKAVMVTPTGIRFDKPAPVSLDVYVNNVAFVLTPNTSFLSYTGDVQQVQVRFRDRALFHHFTRPESKLPTLILLNSPLRFKLDSIHKEPVRVRITGIDREWVIPAGKDSVELDISLPDGVRKVQIHEVINAIPLQYTWVFNING